jgi:hypothetical protein
MRRKERAIVGKIIGGLVSIIALISMVMYGYNTYINPTYDGHEIEQAIQHGMKKGISSSVECPDHPSSRSGTQFTCYATITKGGGVMDGSTVNVIVVMHDDTYQWHLDRSSLL